MARNHISHWGARVAGWLGAPPPPRAADTGRAAAAPPDAYQPSEDERRLLRLVEERYDAARRAKEPYLRTWATSLAFYVGEHYRQWNGVTRQLVASEDVPPWRVRLTDNQMTTLALTLAAKRAQARHVTLGLPNNPQDPDDLHAARLATKALRHLDRITARGRKRLYAELQSTLYGTAFLMPYWDPHRQTRVAVTDPSTGKVRGEEAWEGDQDFEVLDVWKVFPQPCAAWEEVSWCVISRVRSLEWVRGTFGERGALVTAGGTEADLFSGMERTASNPAQAGPYTSAGDATAFEDSVRVMEYYEKPSGSHRAGRWVVAANGVLLYAEEALPHPRRRFPVIPYHGIYVPGRLWGKGWLEDLVDQQRELNRTESQIIENKNLMGRPKWRVPREARVDEDALHSGPGEVVEWSTGNTGVPGPEPIPAPPLPQYVAELPERIIERMRNVAGVHEATVGARLPGAPGVVLDLMRQADESRLTIPTQFAAESWKELDEQMLESIQARYAVPRMIRVFGRDQEEEALAFLGSDLRGNTEVGLDSAEGVTDSIAALRQRILDYNAAGLFRMPPALQVELFTIAGEAQLAEMAGRLAERPSRAGEQAVNRGDLPPERGGAESADGLIEKISLKPEAALE